MSRTYDELDPKDEATYWALMHLWDVACLLCEDGYEYAEYAKEAVHIVTDNLDLELFTDDSDLDPIDELDNVVPQCPDCSEDETLSMNDRLCSDCRDKQHQALLEVQ